jgi:dihydrofolate reductase
MKAIAAMSLNRVIGNEGKIPWHYPEDFKWFKRCTMGGTLLMGRKTFDSIGRPLPGRKTVVLSRSGFSHPEVTTISTLEEIETLSLQGELFVVGGAEIYAQTLPLCSELFLTLINKEVKGDAFFPPFEDQFVEADTVLEQPEFRVVRYLKK